MVTRFPALCALLFLAACEPSVTAPVKVMVIAGNKMGTYDTRQVELTTPTSVVHMTGDLLTLIGGAQVEFNPADPGLASAITDQQLADVLLKNQGGSVRGNFVDKGGVLWPADFQTWGMTSTFYNFEQSYLYYQKIYDGKPTTELKGMRVLYWAGYKDLSGGVELEQRDNAIYYSPVRAFMILPFEKLQKVPLSLNIGVIGHEFAHLVFSKRVYAGASIPPPLSGWTLGPFNLLKSMDEGFADFHGYGVTCTTAASGSGCKDSLLSDSFDDASLVASRSIIDDKRCMSAVLRAAFNNFQPGQWISGKEMYQVGTLIATSLFLASAPTGKEEVVQKALIASYSDDSAVTPGFKQIIEPLLNTPQSFTIEVMINTIASHITDLDLKKQVCKQLRDRLQPDQCPSYPCAAIPQCDTAPSGTSCPVLPQ